uniref:Uncharacterized protein n=1 Tax=Octopus bimaculoides TaxID=37653 RepID=A0A0L8H1M0_OCTBM
MNNKWKLIQNILDKKPRDNMYSKLCYQCSNNHFAMIAPVIMSTLPPALQFFAIYFMRFSFLVSVFTTSSLFFLKHSFIQLTSSLHTLLASSKAIFSLVHGVLPFTPNFSLISFVLSHSCTLTLHIRWSSLTSFLPSCYKSFTFKAYNTCTIALCTQASHNLHLILRNPLS